MFPNSQSSVVWYWSADIQALLTSLGIKFIILFISVKCHVYSELFSQRESFYSGQMITRFLRWKMDAHVIVTRWKRLTVSMFVVGGFSSWMLPFAFCEKNATEQAACAACELTEKHKLYNWLVLSVVLVLLVLLLMLVGFLCHRLWPRDPSRLSRVVRRYEHPGQGVLSDLTQVSSQSSSW